MAKPQVETAEHRKAFDRYLAMGADRSLAEVAREFGKSEVAIANWSKAWGWVERVIDAEKRIADKASERNENALAAHQGQLIDIANKMIKLFLHQVDGAFNEAGTVNTEAGMAYRPRAGDVRLWAELKTEILSRAATPGSMAAGPGSRIDAGAAEMMGVETVERFIVERTTRLVAARKRGPSLGGELGMGALPRDP